MWFIPPLKAVVSPLLLWLLSMSSTTTKPNNKQTTNNMDKMRILCLHGKTQSGAIFRNKIAGARRKLERPYELHFLDGPILLDEQGRGMVDGARCAEQNEKEMESDQAPPPPKTYAWWLRDEHGQHTHVREAFEYIKKETKGQQYDALLGFSQGGTVATCVALSGILPGVRAVVTAGAPYVEETFEIAQELNQKPTCDGLQIPKFHLAGETDAMISVDSTKALCDNGGNGILEVHEQGHLFPTRAAVVNRVLDFLEEALVVEAGEKTTEP
mmetsp:Transcript_5759/g.8891  ORF Transcript_5759/g.8891 Transcript_5759/m.8891 type:complete len:270 (-) Transcript_5759:405-1214(-)